jgi:hypothetical protein
MGADAPNGALPRGINYLKILEYDIEFLSEPPYIALL